MQNIQDKLVGIIAKLNEESLKFHKEASNGQTEPSIQELEDKGNLSEQGLDPTNHVTLGPSDAQPAAGSSSKVEEEEKESEADNQQTDAVPHGNQRDHLEERCEKMQDRRLITVG